jgi:hypothetical protein
MRTELEKALETLKPNLKAAHEMLAAHSEITTALERLEAQNEASKAAVLYALDRIKRDEKVRYLCGYGTEMFHLLATAAAIHLEQTVKQVEAYVFDEKEEA